ncbi:caspase family protein [Mesorhizobium sp. M1D.F.Ca.ET.043.01.1.1]|uniref:caspase family protein n=1 Tax=Mesorhizobium sp. M1D.F.Ca.ET.043.01.1.1 TaxID=2493669 RepID=UPI000F74F3B9|nr:caspase family protein [Mesorhizobium sp. M1D.F.Ca.ET.043.01.1.1]AZO73497.1 hypothetical protein EJ067_22000 [Mesorhizobium sp. M1D.F.Ca.ET.043.01.1.1]
MASDSGVPGSYKDGRPESRVALVIGNGKYANAPLPNPPRDAQAISEALRKLDFEVIEGTDLSLPEMDGLITSFAEQIRGADVALLYFAGHGLQVKGENYLVPVDAILAHEGQLGHQTFRLQDQLDVMSNRARVSILMLDCCRDNPFVRSLIRGWRDKSRSVMVRPGLAEMDTGDGALIAFATAPGKTASDGAGDHSPYAAALLDHIPTAGQSLTDMLTDVTRAVRLATKNKQTPWFHSSIEEKFYFLPTSTPDLVRHDDLNSYLELTDKLNSTLKVPGNLSISIDRVWVEPRFAAGDEVRLWQLLKQSKAIIVEAAPGFGKSTFSRCFAAALARDRLGIACPYGESWQSAYFGVKRGDGPDFPVLVNLRTVNPELGPAALFRAAVPVIGPDRERQILSLAAEGKVVFILDGLDEAVNNIQRAISLVLDAKAQFPMCVFFVTSRRADFHDLEAAGFVKTKLAAQSTSSGGHMLEKWASSLLQENQVEHFLQGVRKSIASSNTLNDLARVPLFILFTCMTYRQSHSLPESKASLFDRLVTWLLESRSDLRTASGGNIADARKLLEAVGFLLLAAAVDKTSGGVTAESFFSRATTYLPGFPLDQLERAMRTELALSDCIQEDGGHLSFWHNTLRDYFAAKWLARQNKDPGDLAKEILSLALQAEFQECIEFLIGTLAIERNNVVVVVLNMMKPSTGESTAKTINANVLRLRLLEVAFEHGLDIDDADDLRAEYGDSIRSMEDKVKSLSADERISAFQVLGRSGLDKRLAGKPLKRARSFGEPASRIRMGAYPVTVQEFARFVKNDGYESPQWWEDCLDRGSPPFEEPQDWEEQQLLRNVPVVGVSWYEARAYCRWLTSEMRGEAIARLPNLSEWQAASGCPAPMGVPAHMGRLLISAKLEPSAPVGIFPERRGPHGHYDLGGLIWSWLGPERSWSRTRRRRQITVVLPTDLPSRPLLCERKARARQRSSIVGFRVVFETIN